MATIRLKHFFRLFLYLVICLALLHCGSSKKTKHRKKAKVEKVTTKKKEVTPASVPQKPKEAEKVDFHAKAELSYEQRVELYISNFAPIAMEEMRDYGIPASITLAQGILESGAGASALTLKSNNHFGIKCHTNWAGQGVYHDDDAKGECFRKYDDPRDSFRDHSLFLTTRSRYKPLFDLDKDDYEQWAKGLLKSGYATDPKYSQKIISLIERLELYKYDLQVLGNSSKKDRKPVHVVQKGDTLYSISKKYDLSVEEIKKLNKLKDNTIGIGQVLIVGPSKGR